MEFDWGENRNFQLLETIITSFNFASIFIPFFDDLDEGISNFVKTILCVVMNTFVTMQ